MGAAAVLNVARVAHHRIISKEYRNFTIPLPVLGNQVPSAQSIVGSFLPTLKQKMEVSRIK